MPSVLFVCLGNICRSPLAEGALRSIVDLERWTIDSAGTGNWHESDPPDRRAITVADKMGVDISTLRARQINASDFERFEHIIAMDRNNFSDISRLAPVNSHAKIELFLDYVDGRHGQSVVDPYYGDMEDFRLCWNDVIAGAHAIKAALG